MYQKEIQYDRETHDYAMYLDGELVGFARNYHEAEVALDQLFFELMQQRSAKKMDRDWLNEGVDPDAEEPDRYELLLNWLGWNAPLELVELATAQINNVRGESAEVLREFLAAVEQATSVRADVDRYLTVPSDDYVPF